jgi:hypothetical protein
MDTRRGKIVLSQGLPIGPQLSTGPKLYLGMVSDSPAPRIPHALHVKVIVTLGPRAVPSGQDDLMG